MISQEGRGSKHTLRRSASSRRHVRLQADDHARPKSLDWDGPVTEVLNLAAADRSHLNPTISIHYAYGSYSIESLYEMHIANVYSFPACTFLFFRGNILAWTAHIRLMSSSLIIFTRDGLILFLGSVGAAAFAICIRKALCCRGETSCPSKKAQINFSRDWKIRSVLLAGVIDGLSGIGALIV